MATNRKQRSSARWWIRGVLLLIVVLVVVVIAGPWLASMKAVQPYAVGVADFFVPGALEIETLSLRWFGGQYVKGLVLRDLQDREAVRIESMSTDATLYALLVRGDFNLGKTDINETQLLVVADESGRTNLHEALGIVASDEPISVPATLRGQVVLSRCGVELRAPQLEPVHMEDINGMVDIAAVDSLMEFTLAAIARQQRVEGELNIEGKVQQLFDKHGVLQPATMRPEVTAKLDRIPVDALDAFVQGDGLLHEALGPSLSVTANLVSPGGAEQFTLEAKGKSLHAEMDLRAQVRDGVLTLLEPFKASMALTPAMSARLLKNINPLLLNAVSSSQSMQLRIAQEGFRLPLDRPGLKTLDIGQGKIDVGTVTMRTGGVLTGLFTFLRMKPSATAQAVFSPIVFKMDDGIVSLQKSTVTIDDQIHFSTAGQVDLPRDKVDMLLGLDARSLVPLLGRADAAAGIELQIPLTGSTTNPKADWARGTKQLAEQAPPDLLERVSKTVGEAARGVGDSIKGLGDKLKETFSGKQPESATATTAATAGTSPATEEESSSSNPLDAMRSLFGGN